MQQLISILGTETSTLDARRLLFKAGGNIERALNLHYNDTASTGQPCQLPGKPRHRLLHLWLTPDAQRQLSWSVC